jgi:signal transduction histidine kinase
MLLICAVALIAGYLTSSIAGQLLTFLRRVTPTLCATPIPFPDAPPGTPQPSFICRNVIQQPGLPYVLMFLFTVLVLLAACYWAIRWGMRPVRDLIPAIMYVGPQNLGHRINPGPGRDELAALARTIDDMMDRIATGYEAQRRFAANASHELRTPLAVQRTLIEVGMAGPLGPDQLRLLAAQLLETNVRNERLIEGLLVLSESDRGLVSRTPLRLDLVVDSVLEIHQDAATRAGLTITSRLQPRVVLGEQVLLERLVTNLVQNAIRYNRPDGTVLVEVGQRPALVIANTGDDVPPDAVAALFEPFRRLAGTRIDHSGGAGLGLAIARSITQAHNGTIAAHSTGRDGLRFEVSFPVPDDERTARAPSAAVEAGVPVNPHKPNPHKPNAHKPNPHKPSDDKNRQHVRSEHTGPPGRVRDSLPTAPEQPHRGTG